MKRSLSHTVWECKYHVVWVPKRRRKIICGKLRREVGTILQRLCKYKGIELLEGKACIDHVHMCVGIPPKYSVSTIVGYIKGKSAMIVFEKYSRLRKNFRGHSLWARGNTWQPTTSAHHIQMSNDFNAAFSKQGICTDNLQEGSTREHPDFEQGSGGHTETCRDRSDSLSNVDLKYLPQVPFRPSEVRRLLKGPLSPPGLLI